MKHSHQSQLGLGPMEVRDSEPTGEPFRKSEQSASAFRTSENGPLCGADASIGLASELFDAALTAALLESKEVAAFLDVSVSTVDKWRNPNERSVPSFAQMLCLPLSFHLALNRVMNRRFGFWRAIARDLFETVGQFAAALD